MKLFLLFLIVYVLVYGQALPNFPGRVFETQLNLTPSFIVFAALNHPFHMAMLLSFFAGLATDSLSAQPLGTTAIPMLLISWVLFRRRDLILSEEFHPQFLLGFLATIICSVFSLLILLSMNERPLLGWVTPFQLLLTSVIGGLACPFWKWSFRKLDRALEYPAIPERAFSQTRTLDRGRH